MGKCDEAVKNWEAAMMLDTTKTNLRKEVENCKK